MKKNNTNLILIISLFLFLGLSFSFVYLLNVIKNKNNHTSAVSITLEQKIAERKDISVLEKKMTELLDKQDQISGYLVNTSNIDKFVEYLEGVGSDSGIDLSVSGVDLIKNEKNKISVKVNMQGDFKKLMKALSILENSPYNIIINSFYLNKDVTSSVAPSSGNGKEAVKLPENSWQAEVSFNVLTS